MDTLRLSTSGNYFSAIQFTSHSFYHHANKPKNVSFTSRKPGKSLISAAKDGAELDEWDKMELKFGRMIGEDPKTTLAKIMGRKSNPDLSYLEIEKLLENRKSKAANDEIEELLFDVSEERKSAEPMEGLNLVRPVARRGNSTDKPVETNDKSHVQPGLNLVRPVLKRGNKFEVSNKPVEATNQSQFQQFVDATKQTKSSVPNVILRKPSSFMEDDGGNGKSTRFGMKPNLSLQMGKEKQKKRFSDITLLRKPEQITNNTDIGDENGRTDLVDSKAGDADNIGEKSLEYVPVFPKSIDNATLLQKPELFGSLNKGEQDSRKEYTESSSSNVETENKQSQGTKDTDPQLDEGTATELQADTWSIEKSFTPDGASGSNPVVSADMILVGKPKILDLSNKATDQKAGDEVISMAPESLENPLEIENFLSTSPNTEREEDDWDRAEKLVKTGEREEVELISSSTRGFAVLLGSLIGFLPYRNLAARWKFLAFESWLRRKGLDPGIYRQNLGIIGKYDANSIAESSGSGLGSEIKNKPDMAMLSDMKLEDLLMIYDEEKLKFLSSFVGQRINVGVVLADRKSRRLIVSVKPKEKEELVEKKKSLMAQLSVGDVVKCCIKKITYFGIFVEVEGVPALIHQTEVSWDATLDPESYFKIGQIVEAKVHQLDFSLERIFLSLKEITPDPLLEALDAVVGDHDNPLSGAFEAAQADTEWADVESLIKELQQFEGIQSVSKGRYFLSPGLAPTFQVYMASMFENQYKLLARAGNRVQEIFVQTSMGKDELKSAIMTCTNRVE